MKTLIRIPLCVAAAASLCTIVPQASALSTTYSFQAITANNVANAAAGVSQLSVEVSDQGVGPNQVLFTFKNVGAIPMSITDIYFDDGSLLGISSLIEPAGVNFTPGSASPPDLPGGAAINFNTTAGFLADSDSPAPDNGVNPGETLGVIFNLIGSQTYADTIAALTLGLANPGADVTGGLRIGIHVQAIDAGQGDSSEAFVNGRPPTGPGTPVPDGGATVALLGLGIAALGFSRRLINR